MNEPVEIRTTRWRCAFCRRSWSRRQRTTEHIATCWLNPAARSCGTCRHFDVPCCSTANADCGCHGQYRCTAGLDLWVTPEGYSDLSMHPRDCPGWEAP